jgi:hypothetical protein
VEKEAENEIKYEDVLTEIWHTWNVMAKVIPLIIGATRSLSRSFQKRLGNIFVKHSSLEVKKTAILEQLTS